MKTATVKMFKERPNGDLSEYIIELIIPSRRRYGAVIREYIEYYNTKNFAKIYFYEVLELETSKNQKGVNMKPNRYPYSGKKGHALIKADPELVEKILKNTSYLENLLATKL